jgi:hypothetical protein
MLGKPARRFGFRDDCEDFDGLRCDVIENSHLPNPQPVLRLAQTTQALYPALAHTGRLVSQMALEGVSHLGASVGRQGPIGFGRLGSQDDLIAHLARI